MKEVRKRSADPAVNQLLIKAYRQKDTVIWDRVDAMQPQCGFGRHGICCTDCHEGPCRVNPFDALEHETACGKDKRDLAAGNLMRRVQDGAAALLKLALDRGLGLDTSAAAAACSAADVMASADGLADFLTAAGKNITPLLGALDIRDTPGQARVGVNMGALKAEAANVMLVGHVHPGFVARLRKAAPDAGVPLNFLSVCGNEGRGEAAPALLTNYDSQELPLLTGSVDLLVHGGQCVMPALLRLAERMGVPTVFAAASLDDAASVEALAAAAARFQKRGKNADIPDIREEACLGLPAEGVSALAGALHSNRKGLVYLGGCGNIRHTQDADLLRLAQSLLDAGYLLATSGCAGTALAKAGLCRPDAASPIVHLGACYEVRAVQELASMTPGLPIFAVMPELAHAKSLAVAVALGASGIPVCVSAEDVPGLTAEDMGKRLIPVEDFSGLVQVLGLAASS